MDWADEKASKIIGEVDITGSGYFDFEPKEFSQVIAQALRDAYLLGHKDLLLAQSCAEEGK